MDLLVLILIGIVVWEAWAILKLRREIDRLRGASSLSKDLGPEEDTEGEQQESGSDDFPSELSDEENHRQAAILEKVQVLCQMAEVHLDDLSDEYESAMLRKRIDMAKDMAGEIDDGFYKSAAIHQIISLAHRAGWRDDVADLLPLVSESFIREKIESEIGDRNT